MLKLFPRWPDEHVIHEERMVGTSTNDPYVDSVAFIPAGESIDNIDAVASVQVVDRSFSVNAPDLHSHVSRVLGFFT